MRKIVYNVSALLAFCVMSCGCNSKGKQPAQPNVIVILADDLGFGDVSAYGSPTINTPNIDNLASGGVCFMNGYATSATSTPSRYALMTGMYPWKNKDAKILPGDAPLLIEETAFTLPKMMQQSGYTTGAIGKWHLGMGNGNPNWNDTIRPGAKEIGFDYSCLIAATNDRVPTVYVENGGVIGISPDDPIEVNYKEKYDGEPTAIDNPELLKMQWSHGHNNAIINGIPRIGFMKGGHAARWIDEDMADFFVGKVKSFLEENKDKPFFLYYGLHQPHVPRAPHSRFVGATSMGPRGDAIVEADWCVGELVKELERLGLLENTLIVFSSDNGPVLDDGYKDGAVEMLGEHKPAGGLRGGKYSLYDGGTHIPLFVYWKGHIKPLRSSALVCQMDLMASLAALIGAEIPSTLDSRNTLDAFLGRSEVGRDNLVIEAQGRTALRSGDYILIPPYNGRKVNLTGNELGNLPDYALFNVKDDLSQQNDIAKQDTATLHRLVSLYTDLTKGDF